MKPNAKSLMLLPLLLMTAGVALAGGEPGAASAGTANGTMTMFQAAAQDINQQLVKPALGTACAALMLQWILSHWKDLFNGELSSSLTKIVGLVTWFGASVWLINNGDLFIKFFNGYLTLSGGVSKLDSAAFTPGGLFQGGKDVIKAVHTAVWSGAGDNAFSISDSMLATFQLVFVDVFIIIAYMLIALSLFVAQLEFWMMFAVAPLAFGLIPLTAFREQGTAPIKGAISLGFRILILGVVVAVTQRLSTEVIAQLQTNGLKTSGLFYGPVVDYLMAIAGCAMMALSSGKIASSIASGQAQFSGSDAIKTGAAMAAGAGAAGAGVAALTTSTPVKAIGSAISKGAGNAVSKAAEGIANMGAGGIKPAGAGSGSNPSSAFGGSPVQQRPSLPEAASKGASTGASSTSAPSEPTGNASSAGIGGADSGGGSPEKSRWAQLGDKFGQSVEKAGEHHSQDAHAVGVSVNLRGE